LIETPADVRMGRLRNDFKKFRRLKELLMQVKVACIRSFRQQMFYKLNGKVLGR
jgi:hypothetical protein